MYALAITINHSIENVTMNATVPDNRKRNSWVSLLETRKTSTFGHAFGHAMASQNQMNSSLAASSIKTFFFKPSLSSASKKQSNSLWVDLSSKLANNSKLTIDKHKKHLKNNLYLYCSARDHKLDSCPKK